MAIASRASSAKRNQVQREQWDQVAPSSQPDASPHAVVSSAPESSAVYVSSFPVRRLATANLHDKPGLFLQSSKELQMPTKNKLPPSATPKVSKQKGWLKGLGEGQPRGVPPAHVSPKEKQDPRRLPMIVAAGDASLLYCWLFRCSGNMVFLPQKVPDQNQWWPDWSDPNRKDWNRKQRHNQRSSLQARKQKQ